MSDLDDLERELGPTLRASLQRAAAHITARTDAPSTEGELMNYLKTPVEHDSTSDSHGGRGRKGGLIAVAILAAAAAVVAAIALVRSAQDDDAPANEPVPTPVTPVTTAPAEDASAVISPGTPYFLELSTGQRTALAESIADPAVLGYVVSPDGTRFVFNTCCTNRGRAVHRQRRRQRCRSARVARRARPVRPPLVTGRIEDRVPGAQRQDHRTREAGRPRPDDGRTDDGRRSRIGGQWLVVPCPALQPGRRARDLPPSPRHRAGHRMGRAGRSPQRAVSRPSCSRTRCSPSTSRTGRSWRS